MISLSAAFYCALFQASIAAYFAYIRGRNPYLWFLVGFLGGLAGLLCLFCYSTVQSPSPSPIKKPTLLGPEDKFWYYVDDQEKTHGPMSFQFLKTQWSQGALHEETLVWHENLADWCPLQKFIHS